MYHGLGSRSLLTGRETWLALDQPSWGQVLPGSFPKKLCWRQGAGKWKSRGRREGHASVNPCVSRYIMDTA